MIIKKLEALLELGGTKKDLALLILSGAALLLDLVGIQPFPFDTSSSSPMRSSASRVFSAAVSAERTCM